MAPSTSARTLHWVTAAAAVGALASGYALTRPGVFTLTLLQIHLVLGLTAGILTSLRVVIWLRQGPPPPVFPLQSPLQARLSRGVHGFLRLVPLFLLVSGLGMLVLSGALPAIFEGTLPNPAIFEPLPPRRLHHVAAFALTLLVGLHFLAALWHTLRPPRPGTN